MAVKNHNLDALIIDAAKAEFLERGYQQASLHKIVERAGITTGALYTRYKGKDDLFCSLVQEVIDASKEVMEPIYQKYMLAQQSNNPDMILEAIKEEMHLYHDILFEHYDACVLFYCKSDGSSIKKMLDDMMEVKIEQTINYFKTIAKDDANLEGISALLSLQFHFFREILNRGYDKDSAIKACELIDIYQEAGWKAVFGAIF